MATPQASLAASQIRVLLLRADGPVRVKPVGGAEILVRPAGDGLRVGGRRAGPVWSASCDWVGVNGVRVRG